MTDPNTPARDDDAREHMLTERSSGADAAPVDATAAEGDSRGTNPVASEPSSDEHEASPEPEPAAAPLSPPVATDRAEGLAPVSGASSSDGDAPTRGLYDDGALRAAEAARAGDAPAEAGSDVDDTRIVAPRPTTPAAAWTPAPAPVSPSQNREARDARATSAAQPATAAHPTAAYPTTSQYSAAGAGSAGTSALGFDESGIAEEGSGVPLTHDNVLVMQKEEFGGIRFGSAFFGWLAATGVLSILFGLGGLAIAVYTYGQLRKSSGGILEATKLPSELTGDVAHIVTVVVTLVFLAIGYYAGGYVAARMARFSGAKQGLAVWLWGVVISVVVGVVLFVVALQHSSSTSLTNDGSFFTQRADPILDIVWGGLAILLTLAAAILGGVQGLRFHRRVDRLGDGY